MPPDSCWAGRSQPERSRRSWLLPAGPGPAFPVRQRGGSGRSGPVFGAHVRLEEAVLHSCLEGTMSDASLEELSVRVSCCRAVAIAEAVDAYAMDADPTAKLVAE